MRAHMFALSLTMAIMKAGRPSLYSEDLADQICQRLAEGESLRQICDSEGFPDRNSVFSWLDSREDFSAKYARARQARADVRSDRSDALREDLLAGRIDPNQARVAFDIERWQAGKENPKRYGDKVQQEVSGTGPAGAINLIINPVDTEKK